MTPITLDRDFMAKEIGCSWPERIHIAEGIDLWIDEEGLLKEAGAQRFFTFHGSERVFAGIGIMCGLSRMGDTISLPRSIGIEEVAGKVRFLDRAGVEVAIEIGAVDRPAAWAKVAA